MVHLTPLEEKAIAEFKKKVQKQVGSGLMQLRLFGSRARGEGHEDSDLDILVLLKEASTAVRASLFEIAADILLEFEVDISPLVMSQEHFEDMKRRERLLPLEIEREGQRI